MLDFGALSSIVGLMLLIAVLAMVGRRRSDPCIRLIARPLMTAAERRALVFLEDALPEHRIHAQVAMGALLRPERGLSRREHWHWRGRFSQKIVDFVVEEKASGRIVALVELDDSSHDATRDAERDKMTAAAGYRTIRLAKPSRSCVDEKIAEMRSPLADVPT